MKLWNGQFKILKVEDRSSFPTPDGKKNDIRKYLSGVKRLVTLYEELTFIFCTNHHTTKQFRVLLSVYLSLGFVSDISLRRVY